jgi:hypothetical protein
MKEGQEVQVNASIDFTINKDDVLTVLMSEREEQMQAEIDAYDEKIKQAGKTLDEIINQIKDMFRKQHKLQPDDEFQDRMLDNYRRSEREYKGIELYDIDYLSTLTNPSRAKRKKRTEHYADLVMTSHVYVERYVKTDDGFTGRLEKKIEIKNTKKYQPLIDKYNQVRDDQYKLREAQSQLEYDLITLDSNKSVKASLVKKIVNTTDFKQFLLDK